MFRQLSTTEGRWTTPDPAGMGAVNPGNPQSWNRYAYVSNNPLTNVDPTGLLLSDCLSCNFFNDALSAANRNIDWSVEAQTRAFFGDKYNDLPGKGDPILQGLRDYINDLDGPGNTVGEFNLSEDELGLVAVDWRKFRPTLCGWGGFTYFGGEFGISKLRVEGLGVVAYDSQTGGEHGGILAAEAGHYAGGVESVRTWSDWQEHTSFIGFANGEQSITPKKLGPMTMDKANYGGLFQWQNGQLVFGGYLGGANSTTGRFLGGGAYFAVGFGGCKSGG
jgi:hypothetical protein